MEGSRCKSRVVIKDQVYDQIQQQRYQKHTQTIERLRFLDKKANSLYSIPPYRAESLDKAKKAKIQIFKKVFPPDSEYKNCTRRIQQIQNKSTKLPKISSIKLYENQSSKIQEKNRIDKQNKLLESKVAHLSVEKQKKRAELVRSIQEYELYKKISRRNRTLQKKNSVHQL